MQTTPAYAQALSFAEQLHRRQMRKGTSIPYISHLLAVSGLVLEAGGTETEAIAGVLHDAAEDCGGEPTLAMIEAGFGAGVAAIVLACSDALVDTGAEKPPWLQRKIAYIAHVAEADDSTLLVSAADKLHNLRSIKADYDRIGDAIWGRFSAPADKRAHTLAYYRSLQNVYVTRGTEAARERRRALTDPLERLLEAFGATATLEDLAPATKVPA